MRNRGLVILLLCALGVAGWFYFLRTPSGDGDHASPTTGAGSATGSGLAADRRAPSAGSAGSAAGAGSDARPAGFDCSRPAGDAARIDGAPISLASLCGRLSRIGAVTATGTDRQQAKLVLDQLVDATLVKRALDQQGKAVTDDEVTAALDTMSGSGMVDPDLLQEQLRERLELQKLATVRGGLAVSEQDVDAELASGAPGIDRGQGVKIEAWMIRVPVTADAKAVADAQKHAEEFARAVAKGPPEAAATQHQMTAMPAFVVSESGVEPALEHAATTLAKGTWSGAIRTKVGWAVIRPVGAVAGTKLDDKALRVRVRQALENRKLATVRQRVIEELRSAAKIEILVEV